MNWNSQRTDLTLPPNYKIPSRWSVDNSIRFRKHIARLTTKVLFGKINPSSKADQHRKPTITGKTKLTFSACTNTTTSIHLPKESQTDLVLDGQWRSKTLKLRIWQPSDVRLRQYNNRGIRGLSGFLILNSIGFRWCFNSLFQYSMLFKNQDSTIYK
jgi:hypothetical protein